MNVANPISLVFTLEWRPSETGLLPTLVSKLEWPRGMKWMFLSADCSWRHKWKRSLTNQEGPKRHTEQSEICISFPALLFMQASCCHQMDSANLHSFIFYKFSVDDLKYSCIHTRWSNPFLHLSASLTLVNFCFSSVRNEVKYKKVKNLTLAMF